MIFQCTCGGLFSNQPGEHIAGKVCECGNPTTNQMPIGWDEHIKLQVENSRFRGMLQGLLMTTNLPENVKEEIKKAL